ncbi:MAG: ATP-binding protein [Pirellulales bacterium]
MPFARLKGAFRSFRARLILWNAIAVAVVGLATTLGVRFAIRSALLGELDAVLKQDAQEILLNLRDKYPQSADSLYEDLTRKSQAHELYGWYVRLIDEHGQQIWASSHAPPKTPLMPSPRLLSAVDKGEYRVVQFNFDSPSGHQIVVRVGSSLSPFRRDMTRIDQLALFVATLVCVLSPLAGSWLASTVIRPLGELQRKADELRPNRLDERLPIRGTGDELDQLSRTINRLLDRLARHVRQRQDFLANAAHELRTPLAALRSTIEVALDRDRTAEEYQEVLVRLTSECESLGMLVNQLLLLAESETPADAVIREPLDWSFTVRSSVSMFEAAAEFKGVTLSSSIATGLMVRANRHHLRQVVNNLIDNAVKYTLPGGSVSVRLERREADDQAELIVEDTGIGIRDEDIPRVFERFFRADKARQKEAGVGGTGLGLSICEAVVVAHGGVISLDSQAGKGTRVSVRLPLVVS